MITIDLLLVGDALDGPEGEIVEIRDLAHALQLYGGYVYTATTLASGATGYTLPATPWGDLVETLQADSDGAYIPRPLFEMQVSSTALTWTRNGDWDRYQDADPTVSPTIVFKHRSVPGATSLLKGVYAVQGLPVRVHCLRLGGSYASGTASGWTFLAKYPGSRYNGSTVVVSGGVVDLTPAPGTGRPRRYTPTSDADLWELLQRDMDRGWQPLFMSGPLSSNSVTIPDGTWTLAGGTDGSASPSELQAWLDTFDLTGIDVVCPVGFSTQDVRDSGVLDQLAYDVYPTLLVAQALTTGAALTGEAHTERNLVSVGFRTTYDVGTEFERLDDAAPMVAGLLASRRFGVTLAKLPQGPNYPHLTQEELHAVTEAGHVQFYHSISKGEALWHAVTGDSDWPISTQRALQEVARVLFEILEPYLGENLIDLSPVETEIQGAFNALATGVVLSWTLYKEVSTLYAEVEFQPYGEVRSVRVKLALGVTD